MKIFKLLFITAILILTSNSAAYSFDKLVTKSKNREIKAIIGEIRTTPDKGGKIKRLLIIGRTEDLKNIANICIIHNIDNENLKSKIISMSDNEIDECLYCSNFKEITGAHFIEFNYNTNGTFLEIKKEN